MTNWADVGLVAIGGSLPLTATFVSQFFTTRREREARIAELRIRHVSEAIAFQRETLLAVQDAMGVLGRFAGRIHHEDSMAAKQGVPWGRNQLPGDVDEGFREATLALNKLAARIADQDLFSKVETFRDRCGDVGGPRVQSFEDSLEYFVRTTDALNAASARWRVVFHALDPLPAPRGGN